MIFNGIRKILLAVISITFISACGPSGPSDPGSVANDTERPSLSGAIALTNTSILVSYTEAMGNSAAVVEHYSIVPANTNTNTGSLDVVSVALSADKKSATLATSSQGERAYIITAVNVTDLAGNVIAQPQAGINVETDPARAEFRGIAPELVQTTLIADELEQFKGWVDSDGDGEVSVGDGLTDEQGNTFILTDSDLNGLIDNWIDNDLSGTVNVGDTLSGSIDSDLDGIQDSQETLGWTVTVINQTGVETSREVTSNPKLADTDGDGVSDFEEYSLGSDPRLADTDNDGLSDFREWNIIFSDLLDRDSDDDGIPDFEEVNLNFTSPRLADTDGDNISDGDEIAAGRNPRIADRPDYSIEVQSVYLRLDETYEYTEESGTERSQDAFTEATITKDTEKSSTRTDAGVEENIGFVEASLEAGYDATQQQTTAVPVKAIGTIAGGKTWTDTSSWQADETTSQAASDAYTESLNKFVSESITNTTVRNVVGGQISATVSIENNSNFTLTFTDVEISVLRSVGIELQPITTLTRAGSVEISPLNSGGVGQSLVFENLDVSANVVEELMKDIPNLIFKVVNFTVTDNDGITFASTDQDVFNKTAGIVIDYGDSDDVERYLVTTAGSNDIDNLNGGGWQGGINSLGTPRGIALNYALQDIVGLQRHYAYDTIEPGANGLLDTVLDTSTDDVLDAIDNAILPGANGWLDTQPEGDDQLVSSVIDKSGNPIEEQGVIAGADRRSGNTIAGGDDIQAIPANTVGIPYGSIIVTPGPNGVLDEETILDPSDLVEFINGYQTSRSCVGNASTNGAICTLNSDCNTDLETNGSCTGPERISRINNLKSGDFNRDWFVFVSEDMPTPASFSEVILDPGQIYRLAFLQDLDRDGLTSRTEAFYGSTDSAANDLDNSTFGKYFNLATAQAAGPGTDVFADSRDSDRDGLDDFAEIKIGWKVATPNGNLLQVNPSPARPDSDFDGLLDVEEMDLRGFCVYDDYRLNSCSDGGACIVCGADQISDTIALGDDEQIISYGGICGASNWRTIGPGANGILDTLVVDNSSPRRDALCAYLDSPVTQVEATFIIAGKNGRAESIVGGDDVEYYVNGTNKLLFGTAIIEAGADGVIDSTLMGDDRYSNVGDIIASTDPNLPDTDGDSVSDFDEVAGFSVAAATLDGGNGVAESNGSGDDLVLAQNGLTIEANSVIISAGRNGINEATRGGDDVYRNPITVATDPLRPDTDGDFSQDGKEYLYAGNPIVQDELSNQDTDGDGLSDGIETNGWVVTINGIEYNVASNPSDMDGDSDNDGLPDLVERAIGTIPTNNIPGKNSTDSDGDGLSDYEEFSQFSSYASYNSTLANFNLIEPDDGWSVTASVVSGTAVERAALFLTSFNINTSTWRVTSDPTLADTDGDGLSDFQEFLDKTDPRNTDTDGDYLLDEFEKNQSWFVDLVAGTDRTVVSAALHANTDGDGWIDFWEYIFRTDPYNANTDGDVYDVSDDKENLIGTNPLDPDDRCLVASFESFVLNVGVDGSDSAGDIDLDLRGNKQTDAGVDLVSGNDLSYRATRYANKGTSYSITSAKDIMVLKKNERVRFDSEIRYRDYGIAAWTGWRTSTKYASQSTDFSGATAVDRLQQNHDYSWGNIRIQTVSLAEVITENSATGDDCSP